MASQNIARSLPQLVAAKPAARELGIPYTTIRDLGHRGEIPVIRIGRSWYFDRRDIVNWVETRKERP